MALSKQLSHGVGAGHGLALPSRLNCFPQTPLPCPGELAELLKDGAPVVCSPQKARAFPEHSAQLLEHDLLKHDWK